jgi:hypothetical protein
VIVMNEISKIREQIRRMRSKGVEPEYVAVSYEVWEDIGKVRSISGVYCYPDNGINVRFEVR